MRFRLQAKVPSLHPRNPPGQTVSRNGPPSYSSADEYVERAPAVRFPEEIERLARANGPDTLFGPVGRVYNRINSRSSIDKLATIALTGDGTSAPAGKGIKADEGAASCKPGWKSD